MLKNLSASGLYMTLDSRMNPGDPLVVLVTLTTGDQQAARIAIRGVVQRTEVCADGRYGVALRFTRYCYL